MMLVPSLSPLQSLVNDGLSPSLVAYRATLYDLQVCTRIDMAEEHELSDTASLQHPWQPGNLDHAFHMLCKDGVIP